MNNHLLNTIRHHLIRFQWSQLWDKIIRGALEIIILSLVFFILNKITIFIINKTFHTYIKQKNINKKRVETIHTLIINAIHYFIVFFYLYTVLSIIGFPISTLLASAGILTIIIGLGAQSIIRDIFAGFLILLEKQMEVGDDVVINNTISGKVRAFGLMNITLEGDDGAINYIFNSTISSIKNKSKTNIKTEIILPLKNEIKNYQKIIEIIKKVNKDLLPKNKFLIKKPEIQGPLVLKDNSTLAIKIILVVKKGKQDKIKNLFTSAYLERLEKYKKPTDS